MPPKPEHKPDDPLTTHEQLQALLHLTTATDTRLDTLTTNMTNLVNLITTQQLNPPPPQPPPPPPHNQQPRSLKISLPSFDGSNPLDWTFQANNYYDYYNIPNNQRLPLAVFSALSWYKHLAHNQVLTTWPDLCPRLTQTIKHNCSN